MLSRVTVLRASAITPGTWTRRVLLGISASLLLVASIQADPPRDSGLLAEGTVWETPYHIVDADLDGPTLLIVGGLHGNEPSGYRAADQIRHWTIVRGRLVVVPCVNVLGIREKTRWMPGEPDTTRNANRNFPKNSDEDPRTVPVRALWEFLKTQRPDWVVDLHEGYDFHIQNPDSDGSSIIYFGTPEMEAIVDRIHTAVNATIDDPERKIVKLSKSGPVPGGLVRSAVEVLGAKGVCFETTFQKQPLSTRTRQHRLMVHTLMQELGMAPGSTDTMTGQTDGSAVRVAVYDAGGTGGEGVNNLERILETSTEFTLDHIGPRDIDAGVLDQFDVVIFPGGSGSKEAAAVGAAGLEKVQAFVRDGGGYVGICAGAFLATANYDWSLALMDAKTFTGNREIPGVGTKSMWYRGSGTVLMELTDEGEAILGDMSEPMGVRYVNGPILSPAGKPLPAYTPLAFFRTEISRYAPQERTMIDTPAIAASEFGNGRVLAISPHPEATKGLEELVRRAIAWAAETERVESTSQ